VTIDGTSLRTTGSADLTLVGPGYDLSVEGITLRPGQQDTLVLSPSRGGGSIAYTTAASETPSIFIGSETKAADYSFALQGVTLRGGGTVKMALDQPNGQLAISTSGGDGVGTYALEMVRTDDYDELTFSNDRIPLRSGDTAYLNFGSWNADRDSMPLSIDRGTKGSIDEVMHLTDG
jgi:hypothetical protein